MHIAILEDDDIQAGFLRVWLESAGHDCSHYPAARDFMQSADIENFDLLMFDWLLPDLNGDKVLLWVRERYGNDIPVIFVTSRDSEADIVFALAADPLAATTVYAGTGRGLFVSRDSGVSWQALEALATYYQARWSSGLTVVVDALRGEAP